MIASDSWLRAGWPPANAGRQELTCWTMTGTLAGPYFGHPIGQIPEKWGGQSRGPAKVPRYPSNTLASWWLFDPWELIDCASVGWHGSARLSMWKWFSTYYMIGVTACNYPDGTSTETEKKSKGKKSAFYQPRSIAARLASSNGKNASSHGSYIAKGLLISY